MKVFRKQGNGTSIIETNKTLEGDLLVTPELIVKWNQYIRPDLNEDCTDIIDKISEEELLQIKTDELNLYKFNELSKTDWYITRFIDTGETRIINVSETSNPYELIANKRNYMIIAPEVS